MSLVSNGGFAVGEWSHMFGPRKKETRCRIAIDLAKGKLVAAQEWTGLKFESIAGARLENLAESVIDVNEAHIDSFEEWGLEIVDNAPEWSLHFA